MARDHSIVHRNLDSKFRLLGMELFDILSVAILASLLNLLFGPMPWGEVLVFGLPTLLSIGLYLGKKGKPERYLQDWLRFSLLPGVFCVGEKLDSEEARGYEIVF